MTINIHLKFHFSIKFMLSSVTDVHRTWSIKRRSACLIFPVIEAVLILERHLFQLRVKHWEENQEN